MASPVAVSGARASSFLEIGVKTKLDSCDDAQRFDEGHMGLAFAAFRLQGDGREVYRSPKPRLHDGCRCQ